MTRVLLGLTCAAAVVLGSWAPAHAEATELRISRGYGIHYLPLYVMEHEKLLEKQAAAAGLGEVKVTWREIDGGNIINTAMIAGSLDIASIGVPGYLTLWAKAKGNPSIEVIGLGGVGSGALYLNTRNPDIRTLKDFTDKDRIALPGIKTSFAAFVLEMAAAKVFGDENYAKLDPLTVGMPYPEAVAALLSGKTEIDAHLASPPFSYVELDHPGIHKVLSSVDVIGNATVIMAYTTRRFAEANPRLIQAFVAALDEATKFVTRDKPGAARIYLQSATVKTSEAELMRMLNDPDMRYSLTPEGVMLFANFMSRVGIMRVKPESWKDLFVSAIHHLPGS